jgi:hypothetical protein
MKEADRCTVGGLGSQRCAVSQNKQILLISLYLFFQNFSFVPPREAAKRVADLIRKFKIMWH